MKSSSFFCLLTVIAATAAVNGESARTDINPALRYYQAFLLAPDISEADMDYLATNSLWSPMLPARFGEIVRRYDAEFKLVRQAADSTVPCDWGTDMSEGPNTLLPGLARCKAVMVGARYRVAWDLQHQHQDDARDDLLAAFTLARNTSRDGTLISVLVQIAAESIGCNIIAENFGKFSPNTLQQLVQGIDAAPARGTVAASMEFEKVSFHDWLLNKIVELQKANPTDDAKVIARIHDLLPVVQEGEPGRQNDNFWESLTNAGGNTSQGIVQLLNEANTTHERVASVMSLPYADFDAQANQLAAELQQSRNPFVSQFLPATILRARQREFRVQVWLAMLHTAVAYRLQGDPGLLTVNDPCGQGPFAFQHFVLDGIDRGFQLKSTFQGSGFPESMIFVERPGRPFFVEGPHAGEARELPKSQK
jgi:hypothetical protein